MRSIVAAALLLPFLAAVPVSAQVPVPRPVETALLGPASVQIPGLGAVEAVLSEADVDNYRAIFALQEDGRWSDAKALTRRLQDRRLMGYVLAQKYLHPTKYRSKYKELRQWMAKYADHPQARQIHRLAVIRQPKGARGPRAPIVRRVSAQISGEQKTSESRPRYSRAKSQKGRRLQSNLRSRIRRGWPTGALELLEQPSSRSLLSRAQIGQALRDISRAYYRAGKDTEAIATAERAVKIAPNDTRSHAGGADWRPGAPATSLVPTAISPRSPCSRIHRTG